MTTKTMTGPWDKKNAAPQMKTGERLLEFCTTNDLVIGGTLFPHHNIHKLTCCSTNGRDRNQIDHLMINGMWRQLLLDVRVKRGADGGSDHHLVIAALTLRRIRQKKSRMPIV